MIRKASWTPRTYKNENKPEDQWACKRSPDICSLFQHYFQIYGLKQIAYN